MSNVKRLGLVPNQSFKAPVVAVSTTNLTLSGTQTVAGVSLAVDDRVLVAAQTDPVENGIYNVKASSWQRAADFNRSGDIVNGAQVLDNNTGDVYKVSFSGTQWSPGVTSLTITGRLTIVGTITLDSINNDLSGIPEDIHRLRLVFDGADTGENFPISLQLGTVSALVTSNYSGRCFTGGSGTAGMNAHGASFVLGAGSFATATGAGGVINLERFGDSTEWHISGSLHDSPEPNTVSIVEGKVNLGGTLEQLRVSTTNSGAAFTDGTVTVYAQS